MSHRNSTARLGSFAHARMLRPEPLGVDGFMLSPAYGYDAVKSTNPVGAQQIFMTRDDVHQKFRAGKTYSSSSAQHVANLSRIPSRRARLELCRLGQPHPQHARLEGPCNLITNRHYKTYRDLIEQTDWNALGRGKDPRCEHCLVHCGFEPAAVLGVNRRLGDSLKMAVWQLT